MIGINRYLKPLSIEEAYAMLSEDSRNVIIGGGTFLKLINKNVESAIDLSDTGLNYIREVGDNIEIGGMTTLRDIETSEVLKDNFGDLFSDSLNGIVGIQLRNLATIGGNVYSKFGFSDVITALLVLDCKVALYKGGELTLEDFINQKRDGKDILTKITIAKQKTKTSFKAFKNVHGDYSILSVAVAKYSGEFKISIGARPGVAVLIEESIKFSELSKEEAKLEFEKVSARISNEVVFGTNYLASDDYRKELCKTLVKRGLMEVTYEGIN